MPREIWNEGRVVGYSAYEIYVKQHLGEDPNTPPATEREWLASSLAMGTSMLLQVPDVTASGDKTHSYVDIYLPSNSRLAAANTIVAQWFDGDAVFDIAAGTSTTSKPWASRITDYGQLISNTASSSPSGQVGPTGTIPTQTLGELSTQKKAQLADYLKIYDGLVIQPGEWSDSSKKPPQKDFSADLANPYPRVRLHIRGTITNKPLVLLTGFTIRTVLSGTVGTDTVVNSGSPQDGDFLGPAVFPWSSKIVFVVPNAYVTYFASGAYERTLKAPTAAGTDTRVLVQDTAVIDMQATKPETYYNGYNAAEGKKYSKNTTNPRYPYTVQDFATLGDGEAVLTVYQRSAAYPPALYGTFVDGTGNKYLNPLDTVAPGNIKMFYNDDGTLIADYENTFPGTTGMNKNSDGTIQIRDDNGDLVDVAGLEIEYLKTDGTASEPTDSFASPISNLEGTSRPRVVQIKTGQKSTYALMLANNISNSASTEPTQTTISKIPTSTIALTDANSKDNISWSGLLHAIRANRAIDLLGRRLKNIKYTLRKPITGKVAEGNTEADKLNTAKGSAYIEFGPGSTANDNSNTIRLYICKEMPNPANVPVGSIGIGWGFTPEG